jgi:hypothetical protein
LPKVATSTSLLGSFTCRKARHGTDGFTSPPKEGVLRIFFARKIRRLRPGLNPRTWVLKASTLPLDHRRRWQIYPIIYYITSYHIGKGTELACSKVHRVLTPVLITFTLSWWVRSNSGIIFTQKYGSTCGKIWFSDNLSTTNTSLTVLGSEPILHSDRPCYAPLSLQPISIIYQHPVPTSKNIYCPVIIK